MITVTGYKLNFKLSQPLAISFHTFYYRESVLVELLHQNLVGIGEAAPFEPITGDSQQDVINQLKTLTELPLNPRTDDIEKLHILLKQRHISQTLRAAFDFAYHDLLGKMQAVPIYKLYSDKATLVDNSVTVLIKDSLEETAQDARNIYKQYPDLKILKIKLKGEKKDIERAKAIKSVSPEQMTFSLDANQGFNDPYLAVEVLTKAASILENVSIVEEPCPKGQLEKLKYVKNHVKDFLVFADESAATIDDVKKVVKKSAAHGVNIKLQKAGGIWPAKQIADICDKKGLKVMVGCMLEGPIGIAAGIHFVASTPNVVSSDLDSDLDMPKHTNQVAEFKDGARIPPITAGLGVAPRFNLISKLKEKGDVVFEKVG